MSEQLMKKKCNFYLAAHLIAKPPVTPLNIPHFVLLTSERNFVKYGQIHIFLVDGNFKIQTLSLFLSHGHEVCKTSRKASLMAFNLPTNARKTAARHNR